MHAFIRLFCLLAVLVVTKGCGTPTKKVKSSVKTVSDQSVASTALVSFFEAKYTDLFLPFSYHALSLETQESPDDDIYTLMLKVKGAPAQMLALYKEQMQINGWRIIIETNTQLLFEKPHRRCIITLLSNKKGPLEIMIVYATIAQDDRYH